MSNMLLVDCCESNGFVLNLNESTEKGTTRFRGKFQEAEATNKNNRPKLCLPSRHAICHTQRSRKIGFAFRFMRIKYSIIPMKEYVR